VKAIMTSVRNRYFIVCLAALVLPALAFSLLPHTQVPGLGVKVVAALAFVAAIVWVLQAHVRQAGGWSAVAPARLWMMAMGMIVSMALLAVIGLAVTAAWLAPAAG
jgi:hypothetical protein